MIDLLRSGWETLVDYFTVARVLSLTIAFFLSGAISAFLSTGAVMKYFGPHAKKWLSYLVASVSGAILAVCSCSVLPMFASIRKKGAGLGPAVTFLFAGPAINILAISMTFTLIGVDIGFVRTIGAIVTSIAIGFIMYLIFRKSETVEANASMFEVAEPSTRKTWQNLVYFATLVGILVFGVKNPIPTIILTVLLILELIFFFTKKDLGTWCTETWKLAKKILPLFVVGIFAAGLITALIPPETMIALVGNNSFGANLIASVFGAFMYFATLTEVPIVNSFLALGMLKGPATALLLAGPSLSLPSMIVITRFLKVKRAFVYIALVILFSAVIGMLAGALIYVG